VSIGLRLFLLLALISAAPSAPLDDTTDRINVSGYRSLRGQLVDNAIDRLWKSLAYQA